jgi:MoaA/NifB/PqqE/SkfB family radical SAM enzyme
VRPFPLRDALLLFDRDTGQHVLLDDDESLRGLVQLAPRAVQFAITNRCNLACTFCSRDLDAASEWTADTAFAMLSDLADAGVLEVAFGGGEPFAFRGFDDLVRRLHADTPLAVHATTNGLLLDRARVDGLRGALGQLRLSLYDDNDWRARVAMLADADVRFGVNYLVTPARLRDLDTVVVELVALGCRDILLLSYNGRDSALHLSALQTDALGATIRALSRGLPGTRLALDVCWGERLAAVPRLLDTGDCGAGRDFVVITSDRRVMPCSFHDVSFRAATAADVLAVWRDRARELAAPARQPGCARAPGFGLTQLRVL